MKTINAETAESAEERISLRVPRVLRLMSAGRPFFARAIERGINFFDAVDMYSRGVSEEVVGRALKDLAKRDDLVIATKAWFDYGTPIEETLEALHDIVRAGKARYIGSYQTLPILGHS